MKSTWIGIMFLMLSTASLAVEYDCAVEKKFYGGQAYSKDDLQKGQYSVLIQEEGDDAFLSRCSLSPSEKKVTCDRYEVDKVVFDSNVKIKKFYVFRSQFDVQLFPDLLFIENNGRGSIAYGHCKIVSP